MKLGMKDNKKRKSVMKVNSVMGLLLAVESGVGLAALPEVGHRSHLGGIWLFWTIIDAFF